MDEQLQQKLKEVKAKIKSNSKDAHYADALIEELVGLQKQANIEPVEFIIPYDEVEHTYQIDDVTSLVKTIRGYFYKYGHLTALWVPFGLNTLWQTMEEIDNLLGKEQRTEEEDLMISIVNRMLQWHTVAFLDAETLIDSAKASAMILREATERFKCRIQPRESEKDIKDNTEFNLIDEVLKKAANEPIPDID